VQDRCRVERPELFGAEGEQARCFFPLVKREAVAEVTA
jgi:hypothetical protein